MTPFLVGVLVGLPPVADPSLRYVRAAGEKFVLESRIEEAAAKDGRTWTSLTDRGAEKMTLTLHFGAGNLLRRAEAVQETARGKRSVTVVFKEKEAVLTRLGKTRRLPVAADVVVTTAPDWSDIFQVMRRYDQGKAGRQKFAGLWIHPVKEARELTFTVELLKKDTIQVGGKKVPLGRYRVQLRSGAYLVWADRTGRVYRLAPPGKPGAAVILEGYEKATSELR
jgi:hypothetical protein